MPPNAPEPPGTPTRKATVDHERNNVFATRISFLCSNWDLGLDINKRTTDADGESTLDCKCVSMLRFCQYKDLLEAVLNEFESKARILYNGWVNKPKAERGTIPAVTRRQKRPVNDRERNVLLQCLYNISREHNASWHKNHGRTPESILRRIREAEGKFDADPVPAPSLLNPTPRRVSSEKRAREESFPDISITKKSKVADSEPLQRNSSDMAPPRGRPLRQEPKPPFETNTSTRKANPSFARSVNTSFTESEVSAVFTQSGNSSWAATQETVPDELPVMKDAFTTLQDENYISSNYESSSFEARVGDIPEDELIEMVDVARAASPVEEELSQDLLGFGISKEPIIEETVGETQFRERNIP
ncbi:hypothetical protein ONS95_006480 [Cadophora gregata]|uniref:uncharacterized protein n=1 Tax=Cadophora gregata TaxID=51156 RepID=UPI0026DBBCF7|nr:uncharacterized protein ONS95_006480 [Cadophora gregata]KAK0101303.1 hypothetical protein ONS95_006480 [Cadophora gregata]KAK0106687.1 hypothetical protein ONS96_004306 [Cadophora gregata f. sp. sojae]